MNPKISICAKVSLPLAVLALLCGCQKHGERMPSGPHSSIVSAEKTSFDEVTAKLDKGGNFYLYLSTGQALSGLSEKISGISNFMGNLPFMAGDQAQTINKAFDLAGGWLKDSGIEHISGVGMSSIAREPGFYYSKLIVHHYPDENDGVIWSLFGREPHPLQELDLLPENTVLATFSDFDSTLLWKNLQKHLEQLNIPAVTASLQQWPVQFQKMTGLDFDKVLASLGGDYGVILTLDEQETMSLPIGGAPMDIPKPGLAIVAKVKSDVIFDRIDTLWKNNPLVKRVNESGLKMRTMAIPLPIDFRPTIARGGDYLMLASSDTMVRDMLAVKAGRKKGFKSTAEFARLSQGIPAEGNNFSLVGDRFIKSMLQIQQQTLASKGNMTPAQVESLQHALNGGTNGGNYSVGVNGSEGWEGYANGSQSFQSAIIPMVAGAGALAAIAIPNFTRARATSQHNACINNLRLIDAAKQQWALENRKSATDTPTMQDLQPYLGHGPKGEFPVCPNGGVYTIGAVGEKPTCSIPGHVLP
jgi:hypothetical protein